LWSKTGLADTTHTLEIKVLGTKNVSSKGAVVVVDAFDMQDVPSPTPPPAGPALYEDSDRAVIYAGKWHSGTSTKASGDDYHYSYVAGSKAALGFTGTHARDQGARHQERLEQRCCSGRRCLRHDGVILHVTPTFWVSVEGLSLVRGKVRYLVCE